VRSTNTTSRDANSPVLIQLTHAGALTAFQAEWLAKHWEELSDDWASHPYCQQLGEHTRAYIDLERTSEGFLGTAVSPKTNTNPEEGVDPCVVSYPASPPKQWRPTVA